MLMLASPSSIDHNLILTGYIGHNQIMIARRLAERLRMGFVDFQTQLERRAEMGEEDLRIRFGETRLKTLENEIMDDFALYRGTVIHVSGATLARNGYLGMLRATGTVIMLTATLDSVLQRLHLALGARYHDPRERAQALGTIRREWAIRELASDAENGIEALDTTALTEAQIIEAAASLWRERAAVLDWRMG
jgi:shikimate kinase